jgi:hypothetical protein
MVTRAAVIGKANEWIGIREDSGNNECWFSRDWGISGQSWCVAFCQSCFYYADPSPTGKLPHQSMFVPYVVQWARDNGQALEWEQIWDVQGGDMVMFTWDTANWPRFQPGTGDHIGMVESHNGYNLTTIEGNTRPPGVGGYDGVFRRTDRTLDQVVCFWRPALYDAPVEEDVNLDEHNWLAAIYNWVAEDVTLARNADTILHWLLNDTKTSTGLQVGPAIEQLMTQVRQNTRVRLMKTPDGKLWVTDLIGVFPLPDDAAAEALRAYGYFNNDLRPDGTLSPQEWTYEAINRMVRHDIPLPQFAPIAALLAQVAERGVSVADVAAAKALLLQIAGDVAGDGHHGDPYLDVVASLRVATTSDLATLGPGKLIAALNELYPRTAELSAAEET